MILQRRITQIIPSTLILIILFIPVSNRSCKVNPARKDSTAACTSAISSRFHQSFASTARPSQTNLSSMTDFCRPFIDSGCPTCRTESTTDPCTSIRSVASKKPNLEADRSLALNGFFVTVARMSLLCWARQGLPSLLPLKAVQLACYPRGRYRRIPWKSRL